MIKYRMKIIKVLLASIIVFLTLSLVNIFCVPVKFDSGSCSGGFKRYIADKYEYEFGVIFVNKKRENNAISYNDNNYTPNTTEVANNIKWNGRKISTSAIMEVDNIKYNVIFEGTRYWFETYSWQIIDLKEISG